MTMDGAPHEDTLDLRIACIFTIFFASLAMGLIPLFVKQFHAADGLVGRLCRAFSGGIILGLAMVSDSGSAFVAGQSMQVCCLGIDVQAALFSL